MGLGPGNVLKGTGNGTGNGSENWERDWEQEWDWDIGNKNRN